MAAHSVRHALARFDADGDGELDESEFLRMMRELDEQMSGRRWVVQGLGRARGGGNCAGAGGQEVSDESPSRSDADADVVADANADADVDVDVNMNVDLRAALVGFCGMAVFSASRAALTLADLSSAHF